MSAKKEDTFIRRMFESYDANNNGVLEKEEFYKVLRTMLKQLSEDQSDEEINQIASEAIEKFDLNKNGMIEIEEFKSFVKFLIEEKGLSVDE